MDEPDLSQEIMARSLSRGRRTATSGRFDLAMVALFSAPAIMAVVLSVLLTLRRTFGEALPLVVRGVIDGVTMTFAVFTMLSVTLLLVTVISAGVFLLSLLLWPGKARSRPVAG